MNTPVLDFLRKYEESKVLRAHMPGHKGKPVGTLPSQMFSLDITEVEGADSLFEADGILMESEENAAGIFGSDVTVYSAGGSTLSVQTMLSCCCKPGDRVVAVRNAHKSFLASCAMLDLTPEWIFPLEGEDMISFSCTPQMVEEAILRSEKPACVYLTSPDYCGRMADVKGIAEVCKGYGLPLLVDNAHGAHLAFLKDSLHPMALGASMCCDSAHKTLPVLTGGGYLHSKGGFSRQEIKDKMSMFGSTSPSYLILASLDSCNAYLSGEGKEEIQTKAMWCQRLKEELSRVYPVMDTEPFHLTVMPARCGLTGTGLAEQLRAQGIECEYADDFRTVLLLSPRLQKADFERIYHAFTTGIHMPRILLREEPLCLSYPEQLMTIREASMAKLQSVSLEEAEGKISGWNRVPCPPGIPLVIPGERITKEAVNVLKKYGIFRLNVVQ